MSRVYLVSAARTPIGKFLGAFASVPATELGRVAVEAAVERAARPEVDLVLMGCARQAGLGPNPARQVGVRAGLPVTVPAVTLNMACGSGLLAIMDGARRIRAGEVHVVVAGGMENMTRVPHLLPGARLGYRLGHAEMVDGMYRDGFVCPLAEQLMGETAETLAKQHGITRREQDLWALRSQELAALASGRAAAEIAPVLVTDAKGRSAQISVDEHPRPDTTIESLAKLPAVFDAKQGTVTAGNSSGITDGAAAVVLMSEAAVARSGLSPLLEVLAGTEVGLAPEVMGRGPVPAVERLLPRIGLGIDDFDLIELNEAFAAQVLACLREMPMPVERVNVNGGAIALGHPIGSTGTRIVVTLAHEMRRRGAVHGLATLCVSGGLGVAMAFRTV